MKRNILVLGVCFLVLFLLGHTSQCKAQTNQINMKFAYTWIETVPFSQTHTWIFKQLEERSKGRVKMTFIPSGSLGSGTEMLGVVKSGIVDFTQINPAYWPGDFPLWQLLAMQQFKNHREALEVGSQVRFDIKPSAELLEKEETRHNIRAIYQSGSEGGYVFVSRQPITTLADLKGKKARSFGKWAPVLYKELDMSAVTVMVAEMYDALQKGVVDINCLPYILQNLQKINEVAKNVSFSIGASGAYGMLVMNLNSWNKLPDDIKKLIREISTEAMKFEVSAVAEMDKKVKDNWNFCKVSEKDQEHILGLWGGIVKNWKDETTKAGLGKEADTLAEVLTTRLIEYRK